MNCSKNAFFAGSKGGDELILQVDEGQGQFAVVVPDGLVEGDEFEVEEPQVRRNRIFWRATV